MCNTLQAEEEQLAEALKVNTPTAASLLTLHDYDLVLATKEGRTHRLCRYVVVIASRYMRLFGLLALIHDEMR